MVGWHHRLNGHEFDQSLGDSEGQGSLACCSAWSQEESDRTQPTEQRLHPSISEINVTSSVQILLENSREGKLPTSERDLKNIYTKKATKKKSQNKATTKNLQ